MDLEQIYDMTLLKGKVLNVAIMLKEEDYTKENAVNDLLDVVREIDMLTGDIKESD